MRAHYLRRARQSQERWRGALEVVGELAVGAGVVLFHGADAEPLARALDDRAGLLLGERTQRQNHWDFAYLL